MNKAAKNIAIIGAGAAGLASIRELTAAGHTVVCFERDDAVGGHWNVDYDALHLITPKSTSMYREYPQPEDYPMYASRDQVAAYLHRFAQDQGLMQYIRFRTEVLELRPDGPKGLDGWTVTLADGTEMSFDAVLVANGHLHHPHVPELPGDFAGKVIHSVDYRNVGDIDGNRVLVVGAGNSGCDLAVDAAQARFDVSMSIRHGFVFMPKSLLGKARAELFINKLPHSLYSLALRWLVQVSVGRPEQYKGLPKPPTRDLTKQRSIVNDLLPYWIQHGRVSVRPEITHIAENTVTFSDGTSNEFDTILLATGFRYHAPFLPSDILACENDMPRRWASGILPKDLANLYFIGLIAPMGAQWPIYEIQASLVNRMLTLQSSRTAPLVDEFVSREPGFGDLELARPVFMDMVKETNKVLKELGAR